MQETVATGAQTQQWAFIISQLFDWVMAGLAWIVPFQARVFGFVLKGDSFWSLAGVSVLLLLPAAAFIAGVWGTMVSLYTIPFRLGRSVTLMQSVALAWWDALRMVWFYWAGLVKFLLVLVGWIWGLLKLSVQLVWGTLKGAITSPLAMLDATSRRPGVPWAAFVMLIVWSAVEATIFTFTLRPTISELLADLTGYEVNAFALVLLLWIFLAIIIAGSFACIQVLNDAIKERQTGNIIFMIIVEIAVAMFEVLFLYRELVDAMTPWLAQQGVTLGVVGTLGLAFFAWVGVRGMTWFLFGRFGAPALIAVLSRQPLTVEGAGSHGAAPVMADYWKGPIAALKAEREWFRKEGRELFELVSLPVLQVVASGLNFLFVLFTGRGHFTLPFKSIDDVLAATHFPARTSAEVARP
ncbi:MAG TPA: hypothetical protein VGQ48_11095 [Gemmatimonadales bacterium]|jgi:hypothetical protein|nr:hypothetical protein [Gemmatimonadales bacterium]